MRKKSGKVVENFFCRKVEQEQLQTEGLKILRQIDPIRSEPNRYVFDQFGLQLNCTYIHTGIYTLLNFDKFGIIKNLFSFRHRCAKS